MHLLSLKCLISPFIWGSLIHSGLVWSFIYPKKYLKETFLPYKSLLDITILWTFTLSMSIKSLCLCFVLFLYNVKQKRWKLFLLIFLLYDKVFVISFYIYTIKRFYNNSLFYLNINFSLYWSIAFAHVPKINSIITFFNRNNSSIIAFALNHDSNFKDMVCT